MRRYKRVFFLRKCGRYTYKFLMDFGDGISVWVCGRRPRGGELLTARIRFSPRKGSRKYNGRQSFKHQPKRFMHVGWYADYMRKEWSVTYGQQRRKWCKRLEFVNRVLF